MPDILPARARRHHRAAAGRAAPAGLTGAARRVRVQARARDREGALEAMLTAEREAGGAFLTGLPELLNADSRALVMALYAAEAQHLSLVLAALGHDPIPDAFAGTLT